jgi:tetratricopeptide (TPR) repeat protein
LNEPLGYINGQAGFLLIGLWVFVGLAASGDRVLMRGAALAFAVLDANLLVLTQSRAVLPAVVVSVVVVMIAAPGRLTRGWVLLATAAGVLLAARWQLDVYAARGTDASPAPGLLRAAGLAALASAAVCGALWGAASALAPYGGAAARRLALAGVVVAAFAGTVAVAAQSPVDHARAQYRDFVALRVDDRAHARFLTGGGNRHELWRVALGQLRDRPLTGVGAGTYATTYFRDRRITEPVRQPHSLELQTLAELGHVGGALLALLIGAVLFAGIRPRRGSPARADRAVHVAALGGFTAWLTQTSVDWLHLLPGVTGIALLCAALLLADIDGSGDDAGAPGWRGLPDRGRAIVGLAGIAIAMLAASTGRQLAGEHYRDRAAQALATNPSHALSLARRAIALNAAAPEGYYVRAAASARLGDAYDATAALHEASVREPSNYVPWALLGDLAVRRGDLPLARARYRRAARLNPRDPGLRELAVLRSAPPGGDVER